MNRSLRDRLRHYGSPLAIDAADRIGVLTRALVDVLAVLRRQDNPEALGTAYPRHGDDNDGRPVLEELIQFINNELAEVE